MRPPMQENDVIISSFGKHPFELKRSASKVSESRREPGLVGGVIQRKIDSRSAQWDDDGLTPPTPPITESGTRDNSWDKYRPYVAPA